MKKKLKILILDDDESILKALATGLKQEGYEVDTGIDGEEGLRKLADFRPDYVIVDCLMPRLDGFEFCKRLKQNQSHSFVKVIMMSAVFTDQPFIQQTMSENKPETYLIKPFDINDLIKYLKTGSSGTSFLVSEGDLKGGILTINMLKRRFRTNGNLASVPLIELLYLVYALKSTGVLTITFEEHKWVLFFYQGDIVKTVSDVSEEYFGSVAVSMGFLTNSERDRCLKVAQDQNKRVGDIMVALKGLKPNMIVDILKKQAEMRVNNLMLAARGTYLFQHALVNKTPKIYLKLDLLEFLIQRALPDEQLFFKKELSSYLNLNPNFNNSCLLASKEYCLTSLQRDIIARVNGQNSIDEISKMFPGSESFLLKYLYILIHFQVINFVVKSEEKESYQYLQMQLERFKNANYFQILGVSSNSSDADVKKSYINLAKEYHPDKNVQFSQPAIKKLAGEIFDYISQAYQTLINEVGRKDYEALLNLRGGGDSPGFSVEKALAGEHSFVEGKRLFDKNMLVEARCKFEEALRADSNNQDYSAYLAWILLLELQKIGSKDILTVKKIIEKNLSENTEHEISNLVAGYIAKYEGNLGLAIEFFTKVLKVNRFLFDAKRELRYLAKKNQKKSFLGLSTGPKK